MACPTSTHRFALTDRMAGTCSPSGCWSFDQHLPVRPRALPLSRLVRVANGSSRVLRGAGFTSPRHRESNTDGTCRVLERSELIGGGNGTHAVRTAVLLSLGDCAARRRSIFVAWKQ